MAGAIWGIKEPKEPYLTYLFRATDTWAACPNGSSVLPLTWILPEILQTAGTVLFSKKVGDETSKASLIR